MSCREDCLCEPRCAEGFDDLHEGVCCDCYEDTSGVCCRNCCK